MLAKVPRDGGREGQSRESLDRSTEKHHCCLGRYWHPRHRSLCQNLCLGHTGLPRLNDLLSVIPGQCCALKNRKVQALVLLSALLQEQNE